MAEATRLARVLVEGLLTAGVRDVVLAPGSRSAPLAYELFEADRIGLLTLHVRIDERSAGFLAVGLAKGSGLPVGVVTTSGTAVANLHPAVLEAFHAHLPLVLLTADRPPSMTHTGANQTTDQTHLFGRHVRAFGAVSDAPVGPDGGDVAGWRFELVRLLTAATGLRTRLPGPVHLDVAFTEPLVPGPVAALPTGPAVGVSAARGAQPLVLPAGPQTVLVAGDLPPAAGRAVAELAAAARVPLLAEPSSNARRGPAALGTYRLLLGSSLAEDVERVVVLGRPTLSRPVSRLLARTDVELVVVSAHADWPDPGRTASAVVDAVEFGRPSTGSGSGGTGPGGGAAGDWLRAWQEADVRARAALEELLAAQTTLTGPALAAALWSALGGADALVVGSSNPVRDLDLAPVVDDPAAVYANRGLAGIDGTVSTAVGVALTRDRPTHALMGDLTLLHDAGGLVIGPSEPRPDLRVVVANDDGGSIFATLEQGRPEHQAAFERIFGTPHGSSFEALAAVSGARYQRVQDAAALVAVLDEPPVGLELVEAVVDRTQRRTLSTAVTAIAATL
ncbi:2-succinyl-5-enolpyruvyl-6-hydroxy-3-cyclohexene-1-carboxylate synthase [Friedmanniella luteola]|uniref:2-succinyl-5-enolpyruvyl-6-hydroxy-3-cyclohexene-1-carboxylate synthase n=1 Tax=Friedmanniella luteola TaxID=546871 RepID=A0A1H1Z9V2_9ACTN|nr:2-succinyl-5-enolpyruvyl-6-hydroxy-3-cyclohexene-1-carboxylic-acid synthase [Friedmanniella luteola]SDT30504.1 2-succinyl-5-enolpyruvyl-6-hydroxy-3-cyclohexene-1-carboxylate synthase [Friedmanniella luteola]